MALISDVLAEANDIFNSLNEASNEDKKIEVALDTAEEVGQELKTLKGESVNSTTARLIKLNFESILGNTVFEDAGIEFDAENGADAATVDRVNEVADVAVREFWLAAKSSFNGVWGTTKEWHAIVEKAADALSAELNAIITESSKINDRANNQYFEFTKYKDIAINNELNFSMLNRGISDINSIINGCLNVRNTSEFESFIETAVETIETHMKSPTGRPDDSWFPRFRDVYQPGKDVKLTNEIDENLVDLMSFTSVEALDIKQSPVLPGNVCIVYTSPKNDANLSFAEKINSISAEFFSMKKEDESTPQAIRVSTLHPEQINDVCKLSLELLEHIQFYDKAWARRTKFMDKVIKDFDKAIGNIIEPSLTQVEKDFYKRAVFSTMRAIKSHNSYIATLLNMVLRTVVGVVAYCRASMSQFGNPVY